jgi:hypothetical protein
MQWNMGRSIGSQFFLEGAQEISVRLWDLVLSEDPVERFIFIADGANNQIVISGGRTARC